jgi:hypothetical protein
MSACIASLFELQREQVALQQRKQKKAVPANKVRAERLGKGGNSFLVFQDVQNKAIVPAQQKASGFDSEFVLQYCSFVVCESPLYMFI